VNRRRDYIYILIGLAIFFSFVFQTISLNPMKTSLDVNNGNIIHLSALETLEEQWLKNNDFSTQDAWFTTKGEQGDNSTVDADISGNQANYRVLGEKRTITLISGTPNNTLYSPGWKQFNNSNFLPPKTALINNSGCYVYHFLNEKVAGEQIYNYPSVHWKKNISISDDMSKYIITDVSLEVIANASVHDNVDTPNDDYSGSDPDQFAIGDSAIFYTEISDLTNSYTFRIAENKTTYLGQYRTGYPTILNITDSLLQTKSQDYLISALTSILESDNHNFTLTLGIDIYCEDNSGPGDEDTWNYLIIKSCNLTITFERKIDQFTSISWNQISNKINSSYQINQAILNFKYRIDQLWPTSLSPFSEIRISINNNLHPETIRLSSANTTFQEAKQGSFDVSSLILKEVNITFSIQLYIANTFGLDKNITISIDDVYLNISYTITVPDYETNLQLYLNGENKTLDPFIELPIGENVNITVKFSDYIGLHLGNASVQLIGPGFIEDFNEDISFEQYSVIVNSTEKLNLGLNYLTVKAQLTNYRTKELNPSISVRRLNGEITTISGQNIININPGGNAHLSIVINNTDFGGFIKNAVVLYSSSLGDGVLTDPDNDGIYEGTLRNIPEGSHVITITALGGEDYDFESYQLTINAIKSVGPNWTWLIILLFGAFAGLVIFFSLYQFHFKYPPMVRKVRKLRKKVKKDKKTKPILLNTREDIINKNLNVHKEIIIFKSTQSKVDKIEKIQIKKEVET